MKFDGSAVPTYVTQKNRVSFGAANPANTPPPFHRRSFVGKFVVARKTTGPIGKKKRKRKKETTPRCGKTDRGFDELLREHF